MNVWMMKEGKVDHGKEELSVTSFCVLLCFCLTEKRQTRPSDGIMVFSMDESYVSMVLI